MHQHFEPFLDRRRADSIVMPHVFASLVLAISLSGVHAAFTGGGGGSAPGPAPAPSSSTTQAHVWVRLVFTDSLDAQHPAHMTTKLFRTFEVTDHLMHLAFFLTPNLYTLTAAWQAAAGELAPVMAAYMRSGTPAMPEHIPPNEVVIYVHRRDSVNGAERAIASGMAAQQRATVGRQHNATYASSLPPAAVTGEPSNPLEALTNVVGGAGGSTNIPIQGVLEALQRVSTMLTNNPIAMGPGMPAMPVQAPMSKAARSLQRRSKNAGALNQQWRLTTAMPTSMMKTTYPTSCQT